jgi:G:T-mismatch repair DNA endonuclease (very short patch repair protein)
MLGFSVFGWGVKMAAARGIAHALRKVIARDARCQYGVHGCPWCAHSCRLQTDASRVSICCCSWVDKDLSW